MVLSSHFVMQKKVFFYVKFIGSNECHELLSNQQRTYGRYDDIFGEISLGKPFFFSIRMTNLKRNTIIKLMLLQY